MNFLYILAPLPLVACTPPIVSTPPVPVVTQITAASQLATSYRLPSLSSAQTIKLGKKIWHNESAGKVDGLTHWNVGEEFPSMGIGHYIWYPKGFNGRWKETFPMFINYAKAKGTKGIPEWVLSAQDCPWPNKQAFYKDFNGPKLKGLRSFFEKNIEVQTSFIIDRSRAALPKIIAAAPKFDQARVLVNYQKVASTANGTYALIDYVNFKGDGTVTTERYNNQGWGMLQVLTNMPATAGGQASAKAFAESAKAMLLRRVKNSPPARGEKRWTAGWNNRCDTYAKPL